MVSSRAGRCADKPCSKDYGAFAPFTVKAGPRSYVILRDPVHIRRVLDAPEHLSANPVRIEVSEKLFGSPRAASQVLFGEAGNKDETTFYPSETDLASITNAYISVLSSSMHDKMFQVDTWTGVEDLWSFLQLVLLRCTLDTLFGSALLKKYPRVVRDYLQFNAVTEGFVHGMPSIMLTGLTQPRDRLYQGIETWLKANGSEDSNVGMSDSAEPSRDKSVWDKTTGSRSIREHYNACRPSDDEELTTKARAAEILSTIHTYVRSPIQLVDNARATLKLTADYRTNNELAPSTFWFIVETLRKSHLVRGITASVNQHFSPITSKHDVPGLAQVPLVRSVQAEVMRLRTATYVIRTNRTDGFPLDKHWSLPKGSTVAMFSHDISLNTDVWKKLQPRALERPLEEFWAERFATSERETQRKKNIGNEISGSGRESLEDLITDLATCDQYPGSRLTSALQMATLAVLFTEFEIQLSDTEEVDAVLPPAREFAYGTVKPLEKIAVRVRKRKM